MKILYEIQVKIIYEYEKKNSRKFWIYFTGLSEFSKGPVNDENIVLNLIPASIWERAPLRMSLERVQSHLGHLLPRELIPLCVRRGVLHKWFYVSSEEITKCNRTAYRIRIYGLFQVHKSPISVEIAF